eukprot:763521-Hanusia_phi.AAC.2
MSASNFRKKSNQRRQILFEHLVENVTGIPRNDSNFRKAVKFSLDNIQDHQCLSTMPTIVDRQYQNLLEKLEYHSQIGKYKALKHALTRLRSFQDLTKDKEREDFVFSCMRLLYHLSDNVLDYTIGSERAISHHRQQAIAQTLNEPDVQDLASCLRSINDEYAETSEAGSAGTLSEWSDEEEIVTGEMSDVKLQTETSPIKVEEDVERSGQQTVEEQSFAMDIKAKRSEILNKPFDLNSVLGFKLPRHLLLPNNVPLIQTNLALACAEMEEERDALSLWRSKYVVSHEKTIVQHVLQMLAGRTGALFTWQACTCSSGRVHVDSNRLRCLRDRCDGFVLRQEVTLTHLSPESLKCILERLMTISTKLERLRRFADEYLSPASGRTLTQQAFALCLRERLQTFDKTVNDLIRVSHAERATLQLDGFLRSLTLIVVEKLIMSEVKEIDLLTYLTDSISHRQVPSSSHNTMRILDFLFHEASMARMLPDEDSYKLLHDIFTATLRPYVYILNHWLAEGSLENDICNEFFIQHVQTEQDNSPYEQMQLKTSETPASRYWQMFAIREGGDIVDEGKMRNCNLGSVTISRDSNSSDDFYTGMTITLTGKNGKSFSTIVKGYIGAKRRIIVELEEMPKEDSQYVITTVIPACFRSLSSRILSAGKSVNVLLYDGDTKKVIRDVLSSQKSLLSTFEQRMRFRHRRMRITNFDIFQDSSSACSANSTPVKQRQSPEGRANIAKGDGTSLVELNHIFQQIHAQTTNSTDRVDDLFHVQSALNDDATSPHVPANRSRCAFSDLPASSLSLFLASTKDEQNDEDVAEDLESCVLPFEKVIEVALLKDLERKVGELNEQLVKYLLFKFHLISHLYVLRRVYFMAAGDVLHEFAMHIFQKIDRNEQWNDPHTLNLLLQSSLPPSKNITYGTISAHIDTTNDQRKKKSAADASIFALDGLYISYSVDWPLNLIINEQSLKTYNNILIFLMQIKRAKIALNADTHADKNTTVKESGSDWETDVVHIRDRIPQDAPAADRYGSPNTRYLLLRAELRHVVNNLENYIMTQVSRT